MRGLRTSIISIACVTMGGCVTDDVFMALADRPPPPTQVVAVAVPRPSPIPWQLTPASTASIAQGESTIVVPNEKYGKVKGTPLAIANLEKPVFGFAHRGRVVDACRDVIEPQAKTLGAYSIQAAAAGPETKNHGDRVQQIFFRIIYDRPEYVEVRQSALLCTIDPHGRVLEAKPV